MVFNQKKTRYSQTPQKGEKKKKKKKRERKKDISRSISPPRRQGLAVGMSNEARKQTGLGYFMNRTFLLARKPPDDAGFMELTKTFQTS